MFDNLRQQSMQEAPEEEETSGGSSGGRVSFLQSGPAAGILNSLTPQQRFILSLMLFLNVSVLGCLALLVFGKIAF